MARYTPDSRDRVRDAIDFVELVGARTELRKAGVRRYQGRCPFHEERTPSFGIDPVEKLYHCFGCGAGGDVFSFVMDTESVDFTTALEMLAERAGIQLEHEAEDPRAAQRREKKERLLALLERTAAWYVRMLWESPEAAGARAYLEERGLDPAICKEFRVGYSPAAWDKVVSASKRAGYTESELRAAGLAQRGREEGGRLFDRFRGRLMFPLADPRGRVVGFGARSLRPDDQPKYLNSSENDVFSKGETLFGTHIARGPAAREATVVLAEGYTDVIALHQAGVRTAVAAMGTALTERQAGVLISLAPSVLLCLDADRAGHDAMMRAEAAIRTAARSHSRAVDVRVVPLPPGSDPADIAASQGADAVGALVGRAMPFPRFRVEWALDGADTSSAESRDRVLASVAEVIRPMPASVLREELVQLVAGRLGLSEGLVAASLGEGGHAGPRVNGHGGGARAALDRRDDAERSFLALCIAHPQASAERLAQAQDLLTSPLCRKAAAHLRAHAASPSADLPHDDPDLARLMAELVLRAREAEDSDPSEIDRAELHLQLARLDREIASAKIDAAPVTELAQERQQVLGKLRKLTH